MATSPLISPDIFKMYDIRGVFGSDLTVEGAELIGKAAGTYFQENNVRSVVVGRDNRISGPEISKAIIKGLLSTGCDVVDVDMVITPMIYFSWHELDGNATAMITASHNPPEYNGFKLALSKKPLVGPDYQEILKIGLSGNFKEGQGKVEKHDIWPAYKKRILQDIKLLRPLKVVIDTGNGTTSPFAPELFRELGCEVVELFTESDGRFPNHPPYPQKTEFYAELIKNIKDKKATVGLAFDGDGDRLGVYDEEGNFIQNDLLAMLFARDILKKSIGAPVVVNTSTSRVVLEDIENHGGKPIIWKTGYPFITEKMRELSAPFGAEISGHFFFNDRYFGFDDALYAAARFVELLGMSNSPASSLLVDAPVYMSTPEFRIGVPGGTDKFKIPGAVAAELKVKFPEVTILDFDGVRFSFPDKSWGLIRPSNTEPLLTGRAEAKDPARLSELKGIMEAELAKYSIKLDW
ncbi:MAG: phosphomannomutase/phosphoglucomutase [Candidatus Blackburnbacteria bacterium]|nr:phosphomannomutase/phosphoglucomutase [Candidatus Blackburnbacteria bacterium]